MRVERLFTGNENFLNFLQGVTDWGNAVSSEAQSLASYNTELAGLELQTGTILETHGVRFVEEQFGSMGSHGRGFDDECYTRDLRPLENRPRYEDSGKPAEDSFDLNDFPRRREDRLRLPETPQFDNPEPAMPEPTE